VGPEALRSRVEEDHHVALDKGQGAPHESPLPTHYALPGQQVGSSARRRPPLRRSNGSGRRRGSITSTRRFAPNSSSPQVDASGRSVLLVACRHAQETERVAPTQPLSREIAVVDRPTTRTRRARSGPLLHDQCLDRLAEALMSLLHKSHPPASCASLACKTTALSRRPVRLEAHLGGRASGRTRGVAGGFDALLVEPLHALSCHLFGRDRSPRRSGHGNFILLLTPAPPRAPLPPGG